MTALGGGFAILAPKVMTVVQTLSMLKTASATASAMQALQHATEGATVTQDALNASMWANPIVLLTAGIIALTVAMVAYAASCDDAYRDVMDLHHEMEKANDAFDEQLNAANDEAEQVETLTKRVSELQKKEELSTDEKMEMAAAVRKLNDVMPDLNLIIDDASGKLVDETGAIIENTDALDDNFDAALRRYALAHNEERITAALEHHTASLEAQEKATARIAEIEAELAEARMLNSYDSAGTYTNQITDLEIALTEAKAALDEANEGIEKSREEYEGLVQQTKELTEAEEEVTEAVEASTKANEKNIPAWNELSAAQRDSAEKVANAYNEMRDAVVKSIEDQMNMFEAFGEVEEISTQTLLDNMQSQIDGVTHWEENLKELSDRGINQDLLQTLLEMGPKGAKYVQAFVNMTEPEFRDANRLWKESLDIKGFTTELSNQLNKGIADVAETVGNDAFNMGLGFARGFTDAKAAVIAAAKDMARSAKTSIENEMQIASPSKVMRYLGEMSGEGFALGLEDTMPRLSNIISPWNDVGAFSGRGVNSIDPDAIYSAVRAGAESAETKIVIGQKEFGRLLRGMGVVMA